MKNPTIGRKITGGFAVLILLAGILGGIATITMRSARDVSNDLRTQFVPEASLGSALNESVATTQLAVRTYGLTADEKYLKEIMASMTALDEIGQKRAQARKQVCAPTIQTGAASLRPYSKPLST